MSEDRLDLLRVRGADLARHGPHAKLLQALELLENDWVLDYQGYDDWLMAAGEALLAMDLEVASAFTYLARGHRGRTLELLSAASAPLARAFVLESHDPYEAASLYRQRGCFARAAMALERADDGAEEAWRAAVSAYDGADPADHASALLGLVGALVRAGDESSVRGLVDEALTLLASAAVEAEQRGDDTTALEHYQTMRSVGARLGQAEHLLEGAVNEARLHAAAGELHGAFSVRVEAASVCQTLGEHRAAAVLFQEAAAMSLGGAQACWSHAADAWSDACARVESGSPTLAENALLARLESLNHLDDRAGIAETYRRLAALPLRAESRDRYLALSDSVSALVEPAPLRALPPVEMVEQHWAHGLAAREMGRDPADALLECTALATSIIGRRRAMRAVIRVHAFPDSDDSGRAAAAALGASVNVPSTTPALLDLSRASAPVVRAEALHALAPRRGTRVARRLVEGLADEASLVRLAASASLRMVRRPEALGPAATAAVAGDEDAALAAVEWLAGMGEAAVDPLHRVAHSAASEAVRRKAARALRHAGPHLEDAYGLG